ncbi:MAG: hypothetical protein ACTHJ0_10440 [Flavipsychrobacter sp.]
MKTLVINIAILMTIAASIYLVATYHSDSIFDRMEHVLRGSQKILRGSRISLIAPDDNNDAKISLIYTLAPAVVYTNKELDTNFCLLPLNFSDSGKNAILKNRQILWQNKDDEYLYIISKHARQ